VGGPVLRWQQEPEGLFLHCEEVAWKWGRGNAFAALGFSEALTYLPASHEHFQPLLARHLRHLRRMIELQQPDGSWLQLLDHPGSYHEMSATCMTGYALARGLRGGWLTADEFRPATDRAWSAASQRIDDAAGLIDVCGGTGPQRGDDNTARAYLDRQ
jgi:unsaturated rhamnogalacturonyl hydrolase